MYESRYQAPDSRFLSGLELRRGALLAAEAGYGWANLLFLKLHAEEAPEQGKEREWFKKGAEFLPSSGITLEELDKLIMSYSLEKRRVFRNMGPYFDEWGHLTSLQPESDKFLLSKETNLSWYVQPNGRTAIQVNVDYLPSPLLTILVDVPGDVDFKLYPGQVYNTFIHPQQLGKAMYLLRALDDRYECPYDLLMAATAYQNTLHKFKELRSGTRFLLPE